MPVAYHTGSFSLVLIRPALNLCTHLFTVYFMITFYALYTTHISREFHYLKHLLAFKNQIILRHSFLGIAVGIAVIVIILIIM